MKLLGLEIGTRQKSIPFHAYITLSAQNSSSIINLPSAFNDLILEAGNMAGLEKCVADDNPKFDG